MVIGMNFHDNKVIINCPMEGANTGTIINIELTKDISLANLVPEYMSRAIARDTTTVAPAPRPWKNLHRRKNE